MKVYIAYEIDHDRVGDYGIEILGVFSNEEAALACARQKELEYLEYHEIEEDSEEHEDLRMTWDVTDYEVLDEFPLQVREAANFTDAY